MALGQRNMGRRGAAASTATAVQPPVEVLERVEAGDAAEFGAEESEPIEEEALLEVEPADRQDPAGSGADGFESDVPTVEATSSEMLAVSSKASPYKIEDVVAIDPLKEISKLNHKMVGLLEQLWSLPVVRTRLKRVIQGCLGDEPGAQWVEQVDSLFEKRQGLVRQVMDGVMNQQ